MKKVFLILILFLLAFGSLYGQSKKPGSGALLFTMENLLLDIESYNDGIQAGMGLKFWILENVAIRGLLSFKSSTNNIPTVEDPNIYEPFSTTTNFSIGAAGEYHLIPGDISPYFGGLGGITMHFENDYDENPQNNIEPTMDYYIGALFGVEAKIKEVDFLSIFAEYTLTANFTQQNTTINLGSGSSGRVGLLFYFM